MSSQNWQNQPLRDGGAANPPATARSGPLPQRRNDGQCAAAAHSATAQQEPQLTCIESWVEVSSHPSSSSVSSIGDEIVTTGLRIGSSAHARRRRLHPRYQQSHLQQQQQRYPDHASVQAAQAGASSQEEYDESETDSDHILTSSTENITPSAVVPSSSTPLRSVQPAADDSSDSDSSDDENSTALGVRQPSDSFRPQPNAFTQPPSYLQHRHSTSSNMPTHSSRAAALSTRSSTRLEQRRTPNFMSPNYQADHDEALRSSLTTLLSCAAAARGRGMDEEEKKELSSRPGPSSMGTQPMNLRLVPESELMGDPTPPRPVAQGRVLRTEPPSSPSTSPRGAATPAATAAAAGGGGKIKRAATPTSGGRSPRATKKKRTSSSPGGATTEETLISPTLLTWVVSAGVVVLVSVVGFGAGYIIGREVGRQEALSSLGAGNATTVIADGGDCGREVIRSSGGTLRRFRWSTAMGRSVAA